MTNTKYITRVIREAIKRAPQVDAGEMRRVMRGATQGRIDLGKHNGSSLQVRNTYNRFMKDLVQEMASEGKIPEKFARRAKEAISWQNDVDNAFMLRRAQGVLQSQKEYRQSRSRPRLGHMKYYYLPDTRKGKEPDALTLMFRARNRKGSPLKGIPHNDKLWDAYTIITPTKKLKRTEIPTKRLLEDMQGKIKREGYRNEVNAKTFSSGLNPSRVPQNRRDKKIAELAEVYATARQKIPVWLTSVRASDGKVRRNRDAKSWIDYADMSNDSLV